MNRKLILVVVVLAVNLLAGAMVLMGQDTPPAPIGEPFRDAASFNSTASVGQSATLEGTLTWIIGDPQSALEPSIFIATLWDAQGQPIAELLNADGSVFLYNRQQVQVTGQVSAAASADRPASVVISSLRGLEPGFQTAATGPQPFANIACKFSDVASEPKTLAQYQTMFGNTYPNLDHYYRDMSYNAINLTGSFTVGYFTIGAKASYFSGSTPLLTSIARDCAQAAEAQVNYATVKGMNIMINDLLGCCAYGGTSTVFLDGANRTLPTTWNPPWAQEYDVVGHEMGHAFGMPHSTGPSGSPPSGLDVYVSAWDVMSDAGGGRSYRSCVENSALYGCTAQGMIAAQLLYPGWMPAADQTIISRNTAQSVLIERLRNQPVGSDDLIARIPTTSASFDDFYTVEVRENVGYDQNNMVQISGGTWTTLIHFVDTSRSAQNGQPLVVTLGNSSTINGPAAMWQAGESYRDVARNVTINIIAREGNAVRVNIGNNVAGPANDAIAAASTVGALPFNASPNTLLATQETNDPTLSCIGGQKGFYTVWYRYTANANRNLVLNTAGSAYDTVVGVFTGSPGSLSQVACNDNDGSSPQARVEFSVSNGTSYYIALASRQSNAFGNAQVSLVESAVLGVPNLTAPVDAATTTDDTPTFTWTSVAGATSYEIALDQVNAPVASVTVTSTNYTPSSLGPGLYYWRVRARNAGGTGDWSATRTLTIESATTAFPDRNRFSVTTPVLTWSPITGAVSYEIQIATNAGFSPVFYTRSSLVGLNHTVQTSLANGLFYWRVRARLGSGAYTGWSAVDTFTIDTVP
jgi:hypothetical protein